MNFAVPTLGLVALLICAGLWGGPWSFGAFFFVTFFTYCVDRFGPQAWGNENPDAEFPVTDSLSVILGAAHFGVMALSLWALSTGDRSFAQDLALFTATGLFAGQVGHPNAHELIHHKSRWMRRLGTAIYTSLLSGHHVSAHRLVHHVHVATAKDPNSAPKGMGFWRFMVRAAHGSFVQGLKAETRRRGGRIRIDHPYVIYCAGALLSITCGALIGGVPGALWCTALGIYAQIQIYLSDYVQHYGLRRKTDERGRSEPVGAAHSWNSPHGFSSGLMLNATRHSDHHMTPQRRYPNLQLRPDDMPILPYSLPLMGCIAMMPNLWRRIMDRRLAPWTP